MRFKGILAILYAVHFEGISVMKKIVMGVLAHVDAGKTTLSEAMLYLSGKIKKLGRVDHRDTYLDTHALERSRGITIFSKQAVLSLEHTEVTLVDTPGHMDFSTEAERALGILDYAVLVISGTDGVQSHTETLWQLLRRYHVPTFVFITKADLQNADPEARMAELKRFMGSGCVDFTNGFDSEEVALCDEALLDEYLEKDEISETAVKTLIREENLFPCFFGSGLKLDGVEAFLAAVDRYTEMPAYNRDFSAKVFKIGRDDQGNRLTYLKICGGSLKVRQPLTYFDRNGTEITEKISQLRIYSGNKFSVAEEVSAGTVCAALGLTAVEAGSGLGAEEGHTLPLLEPVLNYRLVLPKDCDAASILPKLRLLEEEDPALHIVWEPSFGEIHLRLMGEMQIDIVKALIEERFGLIIDIADGRILYKETISSAVVGIGHFEPLRHYAEVHLLLEPSERGSGIIFDTKCDEDLLDRNWQRLILGELEHHTHYGVLIGAPLTDVKITLVAGKAHLKHTEGGDFRQASLRAVRQGLMQAESVILEPVYRFELKVPGEQLGRAIHDIQTMHGTFASPEEEGEMMVLKGSAPVATMANYQKEVASYTHGKGRLRFEVRGYAPCHDGEALLAASDYDPLRDTENPSDSVFCAHGGGFSVPWNEVKDYAHLDSGVKTSRDVLPTLPDPKQLIHHYNIDEKELEAIMEREFGPIRRRSWQKETVDDRKNHAKKTTIKKDCLIVDGYNMIFSWEELRELSKEDIAAARGKLIDLLVSYQSFVRGEMVLVFDGYKIKGNLGERFDTDGVHVVYTKEGETADMYIEKLMHDIGRNYNVRIASSDALIQVSALGSGILRMSAGELEEEIKIVRKKIEALIEEINRRNAKLKNNATVTVDKR